MAGEPGPLVEVIDRGKRSVLGVLVDVVDYDAAVDRVIRAARDERPLALSALAVHGVMEGVQSPELRWRLNALDLVTPDGQPVRWALSLLHGEQLPDRVYGPDLTWRVLRRAAAEGLPVFVYGSMPGVLRGFVDAATRDHPGLVVAGAEPSVFRAIDAAEQQELATRIRQSGARLVLVGLGCPRQEVFVSAMRDQVGLPLLAVGAALDYHGGFLRRPPARMQARGLEWLWRLGLEPRRLWRRYLLLNPAYLALLALQRVKLWRPRSPRASEPQRDIAA